MGSVRSILGVPQQIDRDGGEAVLRRARFQVTAGDTPMTVRPVEVAVVDAFGAGAHRPAIGASTAGMAVPAPRIEVPAFAVVELDVWFKPVALGDAHRCAVVGAFHVDGAPCVARAEVTVREDGADPISAG